MNRRGRRFEAIFAQAPQAMIVIDPRDEQIVDLNAAAEAVLGRRADALAGETLERICPGDAVSLRELVQEAARAGTAQGDDMHCRGAEDEILPVTIEAVRLDLPRRDLILLTLRDLSAAREAEMKLRQARDAAEFSNRAKSQFLANMSHELRTPFNAIHGFARIMADELFGPLENQKYRDYVDDILASGEHVISILNDILDISKVEAGQMELREEKVVLGDVVHAAVALVTNRARQKDLKVSVAVADDLPRLKGDPRALKQITLNLLTNAIKFTPKGGEIECGARLEEQNAVRLYVADTGVGIPEEKVGKIFEPFAQLDHEIAAGGQGEGAGLGLALCKQLAALHGAAIEVVSEVDKGTAISVRFPPGRTLWGART